MTDKTERIKEVEELKDRMRKCGITATEMCHELGMSRATLHRWLQGGDRLQSKWDMVQVYIAAREALETLEGKNVGSPPVSG